MTVRRQLVHTRGTVLHRKGVYTALRGEPHFHFCVDRECRLIYEDNCREPEANGQCQLCRGQRRTYMTVRDPVDCCLGNCELVTANDDLIRYRLAGPGPWFKCKTCVRTHGWPLNL